MNGGRREEREAMNSSVIDKQTKVHRNTVISICRVN